MNRIAQITDMHFDEKFTSDHGVDPRTQWLRILTDVKARSVDTIVVSGDIGAASSYAWFTETLRETGINFYIIPGNHDVYENLTGFYAPDFLPRSPEMYYSFEDHSFKYIFLDSSSNAISELQMAWLRDEVITENKIILFVHHPILQVNALVDKAYPLLNRDEVRLILENLSKEIFIFCGHYHLSNALSMKNLHQFVTIAASYQFEDGADALIVNNQLYGYRIIDVGKNDVKTHLIEARTGEGLSVIQA